MNVNLKILSAFEALDSKIKELATRFDSLSKEAGPEGKAGRDGKDGRDGKSGKDGKAGRDGKQGPAGKDGKDGKDGTDGVSVVDASVDFDNHLVLTLSDGNEIDAGVITADKITQFVGGSSSSNITVNLSDNATFGGNATIQYIPVTTTPYTVQEADLVKGQTLYGVNTGENATVNLPTISDPTKQVTILNEMTSFTVTTQEI